LEELIKKSKAGIYEFSYFMFPSFILLVLMFSYWQKNIAEWSIVIGEWRIGEEQSRQGNPQQRYLKSIKCYPFSFLPSLGYCTENAL
jgi:hypothetical protein